MKSGDKGSFGVILDGQFTGYPCEIDKIHPDGTVSLKLHTWGTPEHDAGNLSRFTPVPKVQVTTEDKRAEGFFWPDPVAPVLQLVADLPAEAPPVPKAAPPVALPQTAPTPVGRAPTVEARPPAAPPVTPPTAPQKSDGRRMIELLSVNLRVQTETLEVLRRIESKLDLAAHGFSGLRESLGGLGDIGALLGAVAPRPPRAPSRVEDPSSPAAVAEVIEKATGGQVDPGPAPEAPRHLGNAEVMPPEDERLGDLAPAAQRILDPQASANATISTPETPGPWRIVQPVDEVAFVGLKMEARQYPDSTWDLRLTTPQGAIQEGEKHLPDHMFQKAFRTVAP